jgi:membrane fusion protein (multidrug efflux system)
MKKWMLWMLVGAGLIFGSVFGFYVFKQVMIGKYFASLPVPTVPVTAVQVSASDWVPTIDGIGFIEPDRGVTLSASLAGLVSNVLFESGQAVNEGDLLVQLDADKERADLQSAQSRLASVKSERDRLAQLAQKSMASRSQADQAEAAYDALLADIDSLKATIARREIRAPFSGITGIRQVNLGQYLQPGAEVVRLENIDVMRIRFIVAEQDYPYIQSGMSISLDISAFPERQFEGTITAIEPAVDYKSGVVQVQATIPNADKLLRAGMYATVKIFQPTLANQIVIPQSAITFTLYGETVYVIETVTPEDGGETYDTVRLATVVVDQRSGSNALITEGLSIGDRVVTSGQLKLSNGARVSIVEDKTLAPREQLPRR